MIEHKSDDTAKKLTRLDGGVQYYGVRMHDTYFRRNPYSLTFVDPKTNQTAFNNDTGKKVIELYLRQFELSPLLVVNPLSCTDEKDEKAVLQTDQWKSWINTLLPLYKAPGYDAKLLNDARNDFVKEKTSAMFLAFNSDAPKPEENVNWDAVSLPGVGSQPYPVIITVAPTSRRESFAKPTLNPRVKTGSVSLGCPPLLNKRDFDT